MTQVESQVGTHELPLFSSRQEEATPRPAKRGDVSLPEPILIENVLWFCRLRWLVMASLTALGVVTMIPPLASALGLGPRQIWPFLAAALLLVSNTVLLILARRTVHPDSGRAALTCLWCQIISDLLVLTFVVHCMGSRHTFAPFAYLFHIVLSCIFVSRRQSFVVPLFACLLYVGCVRLETTGILTPRQLMALATPGGADHTSAQVTLNLLLALAIFAVVWYLTSRLSAMVRDRDKELAQTNRSQRLAIQIQEMLPLANLESIGQNAPQPQPLDLADVLRWCITSVEPAAVTRHIDVVADLEPAQTVGVDDHLKMLFGNLITNAVTYSNDGGRVTVCCVRDRRPGHRHPRGQAAAHLRRVLPHQRGRAAQSRVLGTGTGDRANRGPGRPHRRAGRKPAGSGHHVPPPVPRPRMTRRERILPWPTCSSWTTTRTSPAPSQWP